MSPLLWYWHRLRAMEPVEIAAHVRKKFFQRQDARRVADLHSSGLDSTVDSPKLSRPEDAPALLREVLAGDTREILSGRWKAFGHLDIQVDDPPAWHKDYFVGKNLATDASAFDLNHRQLPGGADIKLIWELSRWHQLIRLAMAGYVLGDERAAVKCVEWLADWVLHNPPYRGWNWTSALEAAMRLVQFTWIDALLSGVLPASCRQGSSLVTTKSQRDAGSALDGRDADPVRAKLRREILPAHVWFGWRYRSFGSSANNHLIGELA